MKRLEAFVAAGVLSPLDLHFAKALSRLGGETDSDVLLAAALASRSPRAGHTCVELEAIAETVRLEQDGPLPTELPWPEPGAWVAALQRSSLVQHAAFTDQHPATLPLLPSQEEARPLVLDGSRLYLHRYWGYQRRLVEALLHRARGPAPAVHSASLQAGLARLFGPTPTSPDLQRLAATVAVLRRFTVISGGPGTGKTTTVLRILLLLIEQARALAAEGQASFPPRIALLAPTGKAAARLKESLDQGLAGMDPPPEAALAEALPEVATTIHRALGWQPRSPTRFRHDAAHPLPVDVVVVDEASMVDLALFTKLVEAVPPRARLILLGDRDQLASVEAGAVLGDICGVGRPHPPVSDSFRQLAESLTGETLPLPQGTPPSNTPAGLQDCLVHLTRTFRFGAESGIGSLARAINRGEPEEAVALLRGRRTHRGDGLPYTDLHWLELHEDTLPHALITQLLTAWTPILRAGNPAEALVLLAETRVLCAHRRGQLGVEGINRGLQDALEARGLIRPRGPFWAGRPVLVRQNDPELGLFNGDVGLILPDPEDPEGPLAAWFPDGDPAVPRRVHPARLPSHDTVFAMTVHQSQGSQFEHPVVVLPARPSPILTRELLYTGITRAKTAVTVVATEEAIRAACRGQVARQSGLGDALWGEGG